eukprot:CAMPEP_0117496876 /NCGR_PEP_ID=MMETSP0784-20121206/20886_1 /TAXON_ID=39447 /ORGANISM="" /LENGTH=40 /DNA_ID= /DNA_START= /DNA_END= /DNA_ORIENTATION=
MTLSAPVPNPAMHTNAAATPVGTPRQRAGSSGSPHDKVRG